MNILCIIPARGGSKGVPGKNIKVIAGKPLIVHTINHALNSTLINRVVVSTDDEKIKKIAQEFGAEVIDRPKQISDDNASSELSLLHVLKELQNCEEYEPDLVVFLQCTSPLREGDDIDNAIRKLQLENADSLLSVSPSHRFLWHFKNRNPVPINYNYNIRKPRQMSDMQYVENGSIYLSKPWILRENQNRLGGKIAMYMMPEDAAYEIDTLLDFEIVDLLMRRTE